MRDVLVVEDDDDIRELFGELLRDAGYTVLEASNEEGALEQLEHSTEPVLVILDVMMSVMSGPELLSALHRRNRSASLAVIALSAGGRLEDVPQAHEFLRKAIDPDHLLRVVAEYCDSLPLQHACD